MLVELSVLSLLLQSLRAGWLAAVPSTHDRWALLQCLIVVLPTKVQRCVVNPCQNEVCCLGVRSCAFGYAQTSRQSRRDRGPPRPRKLRCQTGQWQELYGQYMHCYSERVAGFVHDEAHFPNQRSVAADEQGRNGGEMK
eukprot:3939649-Rhodomonas_salina.3